MKRIITAFLILAITAGFTACSKGGKKDMTDSATQAPKVSDTGSDATTASGSNITSKTDYAELAKKLSEQMAGGNFTDTVELLSDAVKAKLDEKTLKAGWDQTVAKIGDYEGYFDSSTTVQNGNTIVKSILKYKTSGLTVSFTFNKDGKIDGLWMNYYTIPEEAKSTDKYTETDLKIGDYQLDGMLTLPNNVKNPPVVILVQGSGQHDMNETIGAAQNAPFKDIAHSLAEQGIASIRYNKRYYQFPEKAAADLTVSDEVLDDAAAAISYAKGCGKVDGSKIIIIGHSLGGMLAPKIAQDNPDVKGIVSLAGSPRNLADIIYDQDVDALNAGNYSDADKTKALDQVKTEVEKAKSLTENLGSFNNTDSILGMSAAYWLSLNKCNGGEIAAKLNIPMLFMQGGADFQVYPNVDFKGWQDKLTGKSNCTFKLYDGLNHLFMKTNGKKDVTEYDPAGNVDSHVLSDIAAWVKSNF